MGYSGSMVLVIAVIFLIVSFVAAWVWWAMANRIYPGADKSTGQSVPLPGVDATVDARGARVIRDPAPPSAKPSEKGPGQTGASTDGAAQIADRPR